MLPSNPLLQLAYPRIKACVPRIANQIWETVAEVPVSFGGHTREHVNFDAGSKYAFKPVKLPFAWGKLFDQGWFKLELEASRQIKNEGLFLHWQDQGEGTLYVDGLPYYGFDVAHRYCQLPPKFKELVMESMCLQSAIWHPAATGLDPKGSKLSEVLLCRRNDVAWDVYHDFVVLTEVLEEEMKLNFPGGKPGAGGVGYHPPVERVSPFYRRLLRRLDDAVNALDAGGLAGMQKALKAIFKEFAGHSHTLQATLTGHAHIDLVWLWPERAGEYKAVHTFATANRLMDLYPEFRFGYSQPASYAAVERKSPSLFRDVAKRIKQQKWEPVGATEVESDTLMACGEALARSFMVGQERYKKLQGKPSRVLWIPDVFGYAGCLPQIMQQTGVDYFFTTKLTWCNVNKFPYSSFVWRGIDGSEVLVHVTQDNGYNQIVSASEIKTGADAYRQSDVHDEYLAPTGYGDGGGGPTEEMCERARRLADFASMPKVAWGRVDDFFDRLNEKRKDLPAYQGELYLEYHRGVLTTHSNLKSSFRATERALQTWEAARCALGGGAIDEVAWQRLIFAQFHDYIPGSSIPEVYEEGIPELDHTTEHSLAHAVEELGVGKNATTSIFNPLPYERIVIQSSEDGKSTRAFALAPLSGASADDLSVPAQEGSVEATKNSLKSPRVAVSVDAEGHVSKLVIDGEAIQQKGPLGGFEIYPDHPHLFDAWEIDRQTLSLGKPVKSKARLVAQNVSDFEAELVFAKPLTEKSSVLIRYRVDAFQPVLHVEYEIDWQDESSLIKALFPTEYAGRCARFGAPFGSVLRSQQPGQPRDEAQFESAGSRYAAVTDDTEADGLAVITEAKYGFSCRDGELGVSLLRSVFITGGDVGHGKVIPKSIRRPTWPDLFSDRGVQVISLALARHSASAPRTEQAAALADILFTPAVEYEGEAVSTGFLGLDGGESLLPVWAKPDGNGTWTLRLNEVLGQRGTVKIPLAPGYEATPVDLSGNPTQGGKPVKSLRFKPYDLLSLRISKA